MEVLAHVAPLFLAASVSIVVLAIGLRAPRAILVVALVGTLGPAWLVAPELAAAIPAAAPAPREAPRLRILSINVWSANENYEALRALIAEEQPDIVFVQEAFGGWKLTLDGLAPDYAIRVACEHGSDCNALVLSRLDLVVIQTPPTATAASVRLRLPSRLGGGDIDVMSVHLGRPSTPEQERTQLSDLAARVHALGPEAIVAGDFNATPWSRRLRDIDAAIPLERRTRAMFTWPTSSRSFTSWHLRAPTPFLAIDHVYAGRNWRSAEIRRGPDIGSDHFPIIAVFALVDPAGAISKQLDAEVRGQTLEMVSPLSASN